MARIAASPRHRRLPCSSLIVAGSALLLLHCSTSSGTGTPAVSRPPTQGAEESGGTSVSAERSSQPYGDLAGALERAIHLPESRRTVRLSVDCPADGQGRSLLVYGRGLGIWQGRRQFAPTPEQIVSLLVLLRDGGFVSLAREDALDTGGYRDPRIQAARLVCRIDLSVEGVGEVWTQQGRDADSPALRRLAGELLDLGDGFSATGLEAANLEDGLRKVVRGDLAPETLTVLLHRLPGRKGSEPSDSGWLVRVHGSLATGRRHDPGESLSEPLALELNPTEVEELAGMLEAHGVGELPLNLSSPTHTELSVAVLNRSRAIQTRPSTAPAPETRDAQRDFDSIVDSLARLHARILLEGRD